MTDDSVGSHELARFRRGQEIRVYKLRPAKDGAELWRVTDAGDDTTSVLETKFQDTSQALQFLEELDRTLKAGGWVAF
jgi:hypothetical protein